LDLDAIVDRAIAAAFSAIPDRQELPHQLGPAAGERNR
jgi:hypothetical protein